MHMNATIIILGATGDLSKKKLIPSIYNLIKNKKLNDFVVIGTSFEKTNAEFLLKKSKKYIKNLDSKAWKKLEQRFHYLQSDFYDQSNFCDLGPAVEILEGKYKLPGNRLFYLATLPEHFKVIADNLKKCGIAKQKKNWTRVVFEKPFGKDLKSAKNINKCIRSIFTEKQIFRIDHYLGKELVQNIAVARFTNTFLEPLWNSRYIDHVQVIMSEDIGVKGREKFYDQYGALKDVIQNHVLQMLSLTAMEAPKKMEAKYIRDEKVKVLKAVKLTNKVVLGQFKGYKKGITKNSKQNTFVAAKVQINNKRWKGTPFYLIAGKEMPKRLASIYIQFKEPPCLLFGKVCNFLPNYLTIQIQPDEGFYMQMNAKVPGSSDIVPVKMDFCHESTFGSNTPEAYENLLNDVMKGDQSSFVRSDEIEQQWKIVDKIKTKKIHTYKKKTIPKAAKFIDWHLRVR